MKEYLFRGRTIEHNEWVYGYYSRSVDNSYSIISNEYGFSYSVGPESVSLYTGYCDKSGKKIFIGDIILISERELGRHKNCESKYGTVCYDEYCFAACDEYECKRVGLFVNIAWSNYVFHTGSPLEEAAEGSKIIGNIYDNPELVKMGENYCA